MTVIICHSQVAWEADGSRMLEMRNDAEKIKSFLAVINPQNFIDWDPNAFLMTLTAQIA